MFCFDDIPPLPLVGERHVMDLLVAAHNTFVKLERQHPSEIHEWVDALHRLQYLIGARFVRESYPDVFVRFTEQADGSFTATSPLLP